MAIVFFNLAIGCISLMSAATANFMQLGLFRDEHRQIPSGNFKMDQDIRLIATKNISSLVADAFDCTFRCINQIKYNSLRDRNN